ncbi:MAG: glycoside hydrolase family 125 protein [Chloroflexi bacterium]|nr:glycoside hydrolase family 125 protein [Chloroflexota bacterium]
MKPADFGANGINGSVDAHGRIIALSFYQPEHGYVTLTTADPFPDDKRYDQPAVRAYRAGLAALDGFGVEFDSPVKWVYTQAQSGVTPDVATGLRFQDRTNATGMTFVYGITAYQRWRLNGKSARFTGRLSLQRCAYTQLTEGGVIPAPPVETSVNFEQHGTFGMWTIENPALPAAVCIVAPFGGDSYELETVGAVRVDLSLVGDEVAICLSTGRNALEAQTRALSFYPPSPGRLAEACEELQKIGKRLEEAGSTGRLDSVARRGLAYSQSMAIPVGEGACLLTDHMLLLLSWNRDAYYLARALLSWHADMRDIVHRHLIWMFEIAQRKNGAWGRCYLANGMIKDPAFQLDQQLFPLLELAEYVEETGDRATFQRLEGSVYATLDMLFARRADFAALFPTDETPADDPIALPYHLSSHILFWKTLVKLERIWIGTGSLKDEIRTAVDQHFAAEWDGKHIYAYATDGKGHHHLYHDANDFPTVLAPLWGWCDNSDPVWRATMEFAFSPANKEAYFGGHLGSVHTRAAWALGDVQELIIAENLGDEARQRRAVESLHRAGQPDGSLPEAYNPETGEVVSRHWFAWPNAAYACVLLGAFKP